MGLRRAQSIKLAVGLLLSTVLLVIGFVALLQFDSKRIQQITYWLPIQFGDFRYEFELEEDQLAIQQVLGQNILSTEGVAMLNGNCELLTPEEHLLPYTIEEVLCAKDGVSSLYVINRYDYEKGVLSSPPGHEMIAQRWVVVERWKLSENNEPVELSETLYEQRLEQIRFTDAS